MKNCTPLWRKAHFQVKMCKTPQLRSTFRSCDVEKVPTIAARSTFVPNTTCWEHFWKLRCRKSARRCGAKHVRKSKVLKTDRFRALLEVTMLKKVHAVVARSTFRNQNGKSTTGSDHFWRFGCGKSAHHCSEKHIWKSKW